MSSGKLFLGRINTLESIKEIYYNSFMNNEVRNALQRALSETPNPIIKGMLREAATNQYKDRRKNEAEKLGGRFEHTGMSWHHLIINTPNMTARDIKKRWKEELLPQLKNIEEAERPQVIARLAEGLYLSENPQSSERYLTFLTDLSQNMNKFLRRFSPERFSPPSKAFFMVIAQLSEYSRDELKTFGDFLRERDRLPRAGVTIQQTFPVIADWLVQSRKKP